MKRFHVHVHVDYLAKSIGFYSKLFAAKAGAAASVAAGAGVQQAVAVAWAAAASLKTGMLPSVWKCSQAMPCGSCSQYRSDRA